MTPAGGVRTAPARLPGLGHAAQLARDPLGFLRGLRDGGDLVRIFIGPRPVYVATGADLIHQVLVVQARSFDKGALFDELRVNLGNGLVTSAGDFHHQQRRRAQPAFHSTRITHYAQQMTAHTAARAATWRAGHPIVLDQEIDRLVLDILLDVLFDGGPDAEVLAAVKSWLGVRHAAMKRALSPVTAWRERLTVGRRHPPAGPELQALQDVLVRMIRRRRAGQPRGDLMSMLIEEMDDEAVGDELLTLFVAGTGTVSAALAWAFHELAGYPEVRHRLQDEVDRVLAGRPAEAGDVADLPYTTAVVHEVLRMHPVWLLMRRTITPVELAGVRLPPGTEVMFSPHALHRDPGLYRDPDAFDPGRWLGGTPPRRGTFIPFGAGNRLCIGEGFAWTELVIVLATVTARWRMEPVPGSRLRTRIGTVERPVELMMTPIVRGRA